VDVARERDTTITVAMRRNLTELQDMAAELRRRGWTVKFGSVDDEQTALRVEVTRVERL
jgi:hypothetical protein